MSNQIISYITDNNIPCLTWLDFTDLSSISISGNTFTVANQLLDSNYDYIQTDLNKHPLITLNGISFYEGDCIYPRNNSIFDRLKEYNSYSIVLSTRGNTPDNQSLLEVAKLDNTKPNLIRLSHGNNRLSAEFSVNNRIDFVYSLPYESNTQYLLITRDSGSRKTEISINGIDFQEVRNVSDSKVIDNYPSSIYLGNSLEFMPLLGELSQFFLFIPSIPKEELAYIGNLANKIRPILPYDTRERNASGLEVLNTNSIIGCLGNQLVISPIIEVITGVNATLDLEANINIIFYYFWDSLTIDSWNTMTADFWDNVK